MEWCGIEMVCFKVIGCKTSTRYKRGYVSISVVGKKMLIELTRNVWVSFQVAKCLKHLKSKNTKSQKQHNEIRLLCDIHTDTNVP